MKAATTFFRRYQSVATDWFLFYCVIHVIYYYTISYDNNWSVVQIRRHIPLFIRDFVRCSSRVLRKRKGIRHKLCFLWVYGNRAYSGLLGVLLLYFLLGNPLRGSPTDTAHCLPTRKIGRVQAKFQAKECTRDSANHFRRHSYSVKGVKNCQGISQHAPLLTIYQAAGRCTRRTPERVAVILYPSWSLSFLVINKPSPNAIAAESVESQRL